jgi:hypothetical protein
MPDRDDAHDHDGDSDDNDHDHNDKQHHPDYDDHVSAESMFLRDLWRRDELCEPRPTARRDVYRPV